MTPRDSIHCVEDILKYCGDILTISKNLTKEEFMSQILSQETKK